jgi:glc operon protein GlcG
VLKYYAHAALAVAMAAPMPTAAAQSPARLDAASAQKIISGCAEHASQKKQSHAIAVVDGSGALLAFLRMDGNPPGVGEFALQKAMAAAAWRFSTEQMSKAAQATPGFAQAPKVVTVAGGVPVFDLTGSFLGAVGVSGESEQDDAACAMAGIKAAGFKG